MKIYLFLILIVSLFLVGCGFGSTEEIPNGQGETVEPETIKLGSVMILSGEGSNWGNAAKNGIDLAIKEINDAGGIDGKTLSVNHQDNKGDPKDSLSAFRNLVDVQGIEIIIGTTWTPSGLALMDLAHENNVLMISPSLGVKEFNERSPYIFNTWPHDFILSEELARFVYEEGHRKVGVVGAQQTWVKDQTNAFTRTFEELGGSVEVLVEPVPGTTAVSTDALKLKANEDIDAIVSTADGIVAGVLIVKRARELGVDLPLYSITVDKDVIAASEGSYDGMKYYTSLTPSEEFNAKYEDTYGIPIDIGADSAYDAIMLIAQAMRETGSTDSTSLQEYLNTVDRYNGASGTLVSDGEGGFTKDFVLKTVVDGVAE